MIHFAVPRSYTQAVSRLTSTVELKDSACPISSRAVVGKHPLLKMG